MHSSFKTAFVALLGFSSIVYAGPLAGNSPPPYGGGSSSSEAGGVGTCTPKTIISTVTKGHGGVYEQKVPDWIRLFFCHFLVV